MTRYVRVALSVAGSAILLFSLAACSEEENGSAASSEEAMMTEYSEDLSIINSQNGRRSYHFVTPLLEGYTLAREPYREFRKGIKITTYQDDSLSSVDAVLTANYAIYYENRELWEAKGNVVVVKSDGKTLYTQQLFWNARTGKIYSNVDSKIVQNNGRDVFIGEGFESDEEFKDWRFRRMKGRMEVEMKQQTDSVSSEPVSGPGESRSSDVSSSEVRPLPELSPGTAPAASGADDALRNSASRAVPASDRADRSASEPVPETMSATAAGPVPADDAASEPVPADDAASASGGESATAN